MIDTEVFRKALGNFPSGVVVVTGRFPDGKPTGVTISAFASLSLNPPQILFCLKKDSFPLSAFFMNAPFVINILSKEQTEASNCFTRNDPRGWQSHLEENGEAPPFIGDCLTRLECRVSSLLEGGDHMIVIGTVEQAVIGEGNPLLHFQGQYGTFQKL